MFRILSGSTFALAVMAAAPSPAFAQGLGAYIPQAGTRSPGIIRSGPIPGTFSPRVPPAAIVPRFGFARPGIGVGLGSPGFGFGGGFYGGYYGYPYAGYGPGLYGNQYGPSPYQPPPVPAPPLIAAGGPTGAPPAPLSGVRLATLIVRLPAAGTLTVNGVKQPGPAREFTVSSDPVTRGRDQTFRVHGVWAIDGTTYEADRTVTVAAGDRTKLTIVAGSPVSSRP